MLIAGRSAETDVSPGAWIRDAVAGRERATVSALVPGVFDSYVRLLHPAVRYAGDDDVEVRWSEVAVANGTLAHRLMQWPAITGGWDFVSEDDQSPLWDDSPAEGHLPVSVARRLVAALRRHTATPEDCWFGVWHGWGSIRTAAPTLSLPEREHWLIRGPVEVAVANLAPEPSEQGAALWWPADRAWFVATDVDLMSTYVGGSAACVADVAGTTGLEAVHAEPDDPVGYDADRINPVPERA